MRSTYDRRGGNESADASHFLYQLADDFNVSLDVEGHPGILYFARYNHWHGSPWHYVVDGRDTIVSEMSTKDPTKPIEGSVFEPSALFPSPLAYTWSTTKGADLSWVPIGFDKSFQMAYSRTRYGTGYYIYHQYAPGAKLSQPIDAWRPRAALDPQVLALIDRAGTNPAGIRPAMNASNSPGAGTIEFPQPGVVRGLSFKVDRRDAEAFTHGRLRITWDGREQASVDAPIGLFFGAGSLYKRDGREYLVKAFPVSIRFEGEAVYFNCFFPMPFFHGAKIEVVGDCGVGTVQTKLVIEPLAAPPNHLAYFHATYRDHPKPERGKDLVLLDTRNMENSRDWTGSFIGTSFIFSHNAVLTTLEGDPRFFFDDSLTPQAQGTGTEEWGGGGD
jgi:hypothetical protein